MKVFSALLAVIAVVTVALNIGSRVPADTVAMGMGVVLGALTSIPISLLMGVIIARRDRPAPAPIEDAPHMYAPQPAYQRAESYSPAGRDYPPLVIINPTPFQSATQPAYPQARLDNIPLLSGQREFRVIGEEAS
jgi:hypothetical protein